MIEEEPIPQNLGAAAQKKFFLLLGAGVPALLGLAFLWHACATSGGATVAAQGKLVRHSDGTPVSGATLYASETPVLVLSRQSEAIEGVVLGGSQAEPLRPVGQTGVDGSFRVQVPDSPEATLLAVHGELAAALARVSDLKAAQEGALLVESPCALTGQAYDPAGNELANTFVSLVPYGGKEKPRWQTWTDSKGKFRFEKLPAGRLTVSIVYPRSIDPVNAEFTVSSVVRVAAGTRDSYINFGPSGAIVGKVKDSNGKSIPNAEVQVRTTGTSSEGRLAAHLRTKASGDFKIYGLPAFTYRAFVRNPDREDEPKWFDGGDLSFSRSNERWQDLALSPVQLKIRIAPESSDHKFPSTLAKLGRAPLRRLLLFPKGASQPSYDLTSEMKISNDGKRGVFDPQYEVFQVPHVPAGTYDAVCQVEGYGAGIEEDIVVPAEGTVSMKTLVVTRGGPVVVQVTDALGKPVPHAIVSIWWEDKLEFVRGAPGEELCPGPGTFFLRVEADGYKTQKQKFFVLVATQKAFSVKLEAE